MTSEFFLHMCQGFHVESQLPSLSVTYVLQICGFQLLALCINRTLFFAVGLTDLSAPVYFTEHFLNDRKVPCL